MLRLNAQGWTVPAIAEIFNCHEHTVRSTIERWQTRGLGGLWEAPGRGAKRQWHIDLKYLDEAGFCLYSPVSYSRAGQQKR